MKQIHALSDFFSACSSVSFSTLSASIGSIIYRHLAPLLAFLAALNAILPAALTAINQQNFTQALLSGFGQSFVVWFSLGVAIVLWRKSTPINLNKYIIFIFALPLSLALLIPIATINWLICASFALLWLSQCSNRSIARAAALLLLATALRDPATKLLLTLFADQILSLDTWLTFVSLSYFESENFSVQDNLISHTGGYDLLILTGCSAFVNLSLALLLWLALSLLHKHQLSRLDLLFACLVAVSVVGLNTARLAFMAIDQYWYQLLHEGDGAMAIEMAVLLIAALPTLGKIYYEKYSHRNSHSTTCDRARTNDETQ